MSAASRACRQEPLAARFTGTFYFLAIRGLFGYFVDTNRFTDHRHNHTLEGFMKNIARLLLMLLSFTFCLAAAVPAATFAVNTVNDTADLTPGDGNCVDSGGNCSLRAAISEANALAGADTINIPQGNYIQGLAAANEDANAGGDWDINSDLTITSTGPGLVSLMAAFLPGSATERVLDIRSGTVVINQIAIMNGRFTGAMTVNTRGAGIENLGTLTLNLCFVNSNQISSTGGDANGGGIYSTGPALTLNNTQVTNNSVSRDFAGTLRGAGIHATGGTLTLTGSTVQSNTLTGHDSQGGGIYLIDQVSVTITNTSVTGNSNLEGFNFSAGAGMYARNVANTTISGSHFDENTIGTVKEIPINQGVSVAIIVSNTPTTLQISNSTFNRNTLVSSVCSGGGLFMLTFGGPLARIDATIDRSSFDSNEASCTGVGLSGIGSTGQLNLDITNSTISRNRTPNGSGAGISFQNGGGGAVNTLDVTNTTISNNQAQFSGGGVYLDGFDPSRLTANFNFVTLSGNTVVDTGSSGGGAFLLVGVFNAANSIFSDNTATTGPDISGSINAVDFNHIENTAGVTFTGNGVHNTTGFDPQLGPLQNNGGQTQTRLLAPASPLVNVIPNGFGDCGTTVTTDQRGLPRPALSRCDIGAAELQNFPGGPFTVSGTVMTEGGMPIRNIVVVLSEGGLAQPRFTVTGSLGNYVFTDVPANGYTISISSKRYSFAEDGKFINVLDNLSNVNFIGTLQTTRGILTETRR
jgi:CSLREA domain-containing protein